MPAILNSEAAVVFMIAVLLYGHAQESGSVRLSLNGTAIANNSYVDIDAIGEDDAALLCHTDKPDCCDKPNKAGEWYYLNGTIVRIKGGSQDEFYRNRGTQVVRLNHRHNGSFTERGLFQCEIPDSSNMIQTVYVHILSFKPGPYVAVGPLNISESTIGDTITITCSTEFIPYPPPTVDVKFEWFFGPDNSTLPADVKNCYSSTCSSTLRFSTLQSTHAGIYTCHFCVNGGNIHLTASTLVMLQSSTTSSMGGSNNIIAVVTAAMLIVIFIVIIVPVM